MKRQLLAIGLVLSLGACNAATLKEVQFRDEKRCAEWGTREVMVYAYPRGVTGAENMTGQQPAYIQARVCVKFVDGGTAG